MKNIILLLLFTTVVLFTGCSSQKFYTVEPAEKGFDFYEGRKVLSKTINDVDVYMNYEYQERNNHVFYLFAVNNSDDYVTIDPALIKSIQSGNTLNQVTVVPMNPEKEIELLRNRQEELEDSHAANVGLNCLFATVDVVADIADGEGEEAVADAGYWASEMEYEQDSYEFESGELARHRSVWENEAFRITNLHPGEEVGGLMFLPIQPDAAKINFNVKLNNSILEFRFLQVIR